MFAFELKIASLDLFMFSCCFLSFLFLKFLHTFLSLCLRSIYIFVSAVGEFKLNCFHNTAFFSNVLCSHLAKAILILRSFHWGVGIEKTKCH